MTQNQIQAIVFDGSEEIAIFAQTVLNGIDHPELLDICEYVDQTLSALTSKHMVQLELSLIAECVSEDLDQLLENNQSNLTNTKQAVLTLGNYLLYKLTAMDAYVDDCLPFKHRKTCTDGTIILSLS